MSQPESTPAKKSFSPDWFVRGILTKLGETFDRFTGRNWKPSSSLATSQLIEKLKMLLDAEAKDLGEKGKVVPHHIKLKMQWDKFSTDAEQSLKKLEIELLTAAIDHINDRRYHTYAPLQFEIKPDYFTEGVKLSASFDKFDDEREDEPDEVNVTLPDLKNVVIPSTEKEIVEPEKEIFIASFTVNNQPKQVKLAFSPKERKSVGRTKENDLWLDDAGVSKLHAALVLGGDGQLMVADTGSTNGTFINGVRIAYGKAIVLMDTDKLSFGTVDVELRRVLKEKAEEEFNAQVSFEEKFDTNSNFSARENIRMKNEYATKEDFSTNINFSTNEIPANGQILQENVSPLTTAKLFITKDDFTKEKTSLSEDENEIVADFDDKTFGEIAKDKV
jgi:pSer/pThr/pTyr-binding forkhead associated (FHA) protein